MSGNRILFSVVLAVLVLLVVALVNLATGEPDGPEALLGLVWILVGIGAVLLIIRLVRDAFRRR